MAEQIKRKQYLDIAKGIGIFLVVWAHARAPYTAWIYQFHMPLFFLISGYLHSTKKPFKDFATGKVKRLYVPFVFWNVIMAVIAHVLGNYGWLNVKYVIVKTIKILLTIDKDGCFMGATWFLPALMWVSIIYKLIEMALKNFKYKIVAMPLIGVAIGVIGFVALLPFGIGRTLVLYLFYAVGALVKNLKITVKPVLEAVIAIAGLVIFCVIGKFNHANMGAGDYSSPLLFVIGALLASYFVIWLSKMIENAVKLKSIANFWSYLGVNSMDILIWQFVFFRVVQIIQIKLWGMRMNLILTNPTPDFMRFPWWIAYLVVGLVLPLLWCKLLKRGPWGKYVRKYGL